MSEPFRGSVGEKREMKGSVEVVVVVVVEVGAAEHEVGMVKGRE
ncbi:hypothetical protein A2U01_0063377 [Trifolium medium]|uniref:Uncharacterized protein n=1 Tax=Trifolium medium TaxID=97028 RepID=A0A392RZU2_9FABA|nr:hypothetical protein [Trifolium medium]